MSARSPFTQEPHKLLVIPGPIEVADDVLYANAHPVMSHIAPDFIPVLGDCIRMIREVVIAPTAQPFLISGSGTLGWDQVAANLVEPGEEVLVLATGYFGDSFTECLKSYGAKAEQLTASPIGAATTQQELERALKGKQFKAVAFTHVDTSTGVLNDAKMICDTVKRISPSTLVFADCVCSVASEELRQEEWGVDVIIAAPQKGIGCPPGLSIVTASQKAMEVFRNRKSPVATYYASWHKWLPVMQAYEAGNAAYFATPPVNLIRAFHASLRTILNNKPSLSDRIRLHTEVSGRVKKACEDLGLKQVPTDPKWAANGMTAVYAPDGVAVADIIAEMGKLDVVIAGGLHKDIRTKYLRIGHMGVSAVDSARKDVDKTLEALRKAMSTLGK